VRRGVTVDDDDDDGDDGARQGWGEVNRTESRRRRR